MPVLHNVYFSAKGTTKACADCIAENLRMEAKTYDWLREPCTEPAAIPAGDVLLFSMPVYGGLIPPDCADMAENLKGENTPAIIAAVYGNRHYDNALLQMKDILTAQGFRVIAAGAFLAEHSIFPNVAAGRPDEKDKAAMAAFAAECLRILPEAARYGEIEVPGVPGYDAHAFKGGSMRPTGDESCVGCGACAAICPRKAISADDYQATNAALCMACGACISACPTGARNYHGDAYKGAAVGFAERCAAYRTPETFYAAKK